MADFINKKSLKWSVGGGNFRSTSSDAMKDCDCLKQSILPALKK